MQPKRIAVQKAFNQRQETTFAQTTTNLSSMQQPFREVANFAPREFTAQDFAGDEFGTPEFAAMDYALPEIADARFARLMGVGAANGSSSVHVQSFYQVAKRSFDFSVALVLLVMASPLLFALAVLVKVSSKGPVFFKHRRLGRNGTGDLFCVTTEL